MCNTWSHHRKTGDTHKAKLRCYSYLSNNFLKNRPVPTEWIAFSGFQEPGNSLGIKLGERSSALRGNNTSPRLLAKTTVHTCKGRLRAPTLSYKLLIYPRSLSFSRVKPSPRISVHQDLAPRRGVGNARRTLRNVHSHQQWSRFARSRILRCGYSQGINRPGSSPL